MWWALFIVLALIVIGLIVIPLAGRAEDWETTRVDRELLKSLRRDKARAFRELKDLDVERDAGTIDPEAYETMRRSITLEAARVNRRLAELESTLAGSAASLSEPRATTEPVESEGKSES